MRLLVITVCLIQTLGSRVYATKCTLTDEEWIGHEYPRLKSWSNIYASYKSYTPQCDDGFMAEGYTHAIVKMLSAHWEKLDDLAGLSRQDAAFRRFAMIPGATPAHTRAQHCQCPALQFSVARVISHRSDPIPVAHFRVPTKRRRKQ